MAIGIMFAGILSGFSGVMLSLLAGHPVLVALLMYPLAGIAGAVLFILFALGFAPVLRVPMTPAAVSAESRRN